MRERVFLSSSCLGPSHFFHVHFSSKRSLKYSFVTDVREKVQGPSNPELEAELTIAMSLLRQFLPILMAATKIMSTGECNYVLIIEPELPSALVNLWSLRKYIPHTVEDGPQVVWALWSIREAAVGGSLGRETVNSAWAPGNRRTSHFLQRDPKMINNINH